MSVCGWIAQKIKTLIKKVAKRKRSGGMRQACLVNSFLLFLHLFRESCFSFCFFFVCVLLPDAHLFSLFLFLALFVFLFGFTSLGLTSMFPPQFVCYT